MTLSYKIHTATTGDVSGEALGYSFSFPSLSEDDLTVTVGGSPKNKPADYTVINWTADAGQNPYIKFATQAARGTGTIRISRGTTSSSPTHDFQVGSAIKAADLNTCNKQNIYLAQENRDSINALALGDASSAIQIDSANIKNLTIQAIDLATDAVETDKIKNLNVTTGKIADLNVTTAKLANSTGTSDGVTTSKIADGAVTQAKINSAVIFTPVGTVITYAGSTAPTGYLKSNGDTIPNGTGTVQGVTADFSALYAIVGSALPDLRGEFVRGLDDSRGVDSGRTIRTTQTDDNKQHNHSISVSGTTSNKSLTGSVRRISEGYRAQGTASGVFTKVNDGNNSITGSSSSSPVAGFTMDASHDHTFSASGTSGDQGSESRPRNVALLMCIKY